VEPQLDELYTQKQSYLMKMMFNQSNQGSALRLPKRPEPELRASHQDFLLEEMLDMSLDFQEEARAKRLLALRLSREAQRELARRVSLQRQRLHEAEEQRRRERAVMQIDDILPDNPTALQKMASITGILNESVVGGGNNDHLNGFFEDGGYQFQDDVSNNFGGEDMFFDQLAPLPSLREDPVVP
jgi:hypothetical protein